MERIVTFWLRYLQDWYKTVLLLYCIIGTAINNMQTVPITGNLHRRKEVAKKKTVDLITVWFI